MTVYQGRELSQVSFLLQQTFCHDKHMSVTTKHVCWHLYACCHKAFVATTNMCLSEQIFVMRKKEKFTSKIFCHDKHNFVVTKVLSQEAYFCCDKRHVLSKQTCVFSQQTHVCRNKTVVKRKIIPPANDNYCVWLSSLP